MNSMLAKLSEFATATIQDILDERDLLRQQRENSRVWLLELANLLNAKPGPFGVVNCDVRNLSDVQSQVRSAVVQLQQERAELQREVAALKNQANLDRLGR